MFAPLSPHLALFGRYLMGLVLCVGLAYVVALEKAYVLRNEGALSPADWAEVSLCVVFCGLVGTLSGYNAIVLIKALYF